MKNYLQAYINHVQNDWMDHLLIAKFAINNHLNTSTGMTLFFDNNSFHPRTSIEPPQLTKKTN